MGRRKHPKYEYARWLFFEQGVEDLAQIAKVTGIAGKTLEKWRAQEHWLEEKAQAATHAAAEAEEPVQSLDDVIKVFTGILLEKARELKNTPIGDIDTSIMDGLHKFVKSIKEMSHELRLLSQKQLLLTAMDIVDFCSAEHERGHLEQADMLRFHDVMSNYCDSRLQKSSRLL
jgi:hypothetical protein